MKLTFVGTGSAFCMDNYQTNMLISRNGRNLLIDAGGDIRFGLKEIGMGYKDINSIYVTHCHADHIGGLEWFAFCTYFDPTVIEKIELIGNNKLVRELWDNCLKGGLKSIQGYQPRLHDYFDLVQVRENRKFDWEGITFEIVQSIHIMNKYAIVPSFGLMITDPDTGKKIYYTGDTQFNPNQIRDFYDEADLIIQDCETSPFKSGVHANYSELRSDELSPEIRAKMLLQHYQDNVLDVPDNPYVYVKKDLNGIYEILGEALNAAREECDELISHAKCRIFDLMETGLGEPTIKLKDEWNEKAKADGFMVIPNAPFLFDSYGFIPKGLELDTVQLFEPSG